ncbi:MAG: hypothetical protein V4691_05000 [Pseudomonadota bacterium]
MSAEGSLSVKLQKLLATLPPATRQALERAVEKARQNGLQDPIFDLLGQQFEQVNLAKKTTRLPDPKRMFMRPLGPFLVDARPPQKTSGRIWRGALQGLWTWIEQNLAGEEVQLCRQKLRDAQNEAVLENIERDLRASILPKLENELDRAQQTPDTRRRFAYHVGGESQLQELEDIFVLQKYCDIVHALDKELPEAPSINSQQDLEKIKKVFGRLAGTDPRLPYYAGVILHDRLEQSALPLWALACVGSDDLKQIANSPFASLIEIALGDAGLMAEQCISELNKPSENNQAVLYAENYAVICRNLRSAVDFETQTSDWLRQLSETRMRLSNALGEELEQMFQLMRRNVRPIRAFRSQQPLPPDEFDLDRLCFLIAMLNTVRSNIQEFALNEVVNKIYTECDSYLQMAIDSLQEDLRTHNDDGYTRIVHAYAQAAVRVSEVWHGEKQAMLVQRSFETAGAMTQKAASG